MPPPPWELGRVLNQRLSSPAPLTGPGAPCFPVLELCAYAAMSRFLCRCRNPNPGPQVASLSRLSCHSIPHGFLWGVGELGNEAGVSLCSLGWPELTEMRQPQLPKSWARRCRPCAVSSAGRFSAWLAYAVHQRRLLGSVCFSCLLTGLWSVAPGEKSLGLR